MSSGTAVEHAARQSWWDPHPWSEIRPLVFLGAACFIGGVVLAKRAWANHNATLKSVAQSIYVVGLGLLALSGIMAVSANGAKAITFMIGVILVPAGLIYTMIFVFGGPNACEPGEGAGEPKDDDVELQQPTRTRGTGSEEENVPLKMSVGNASKDTLV